MPKDLWDKYYLRTSLNGHALFSVFTALHDFGSKPEIKGAIDLELAYSGCRVTASTALSAPQMRDLASMLTLHADRLDNELQHALAALLAIKEETQQAPATNPSALYREPEAEEA